MNPPTKPQQRQYSIDPNRSRLESRRIVLPIGYEMYQTKMVTAEQAKACLNEFMDKHPELFPASMKSGYKLHGWTTSEKMPDVRLRRIRLQTSDDLGRKLAYTIAPSDLLPYMTGHVSEIEKALFLKHLGVPDWALTYVFGRNDSFWYRLGQSFGRYDLVGSTVKDAANLPLDLLADEKHAKAHGQKWYIATTVAQDCVLGVAVSPTADTDGLHAAYSVFKQEARQLNAEYTPNSVNVDGWQATSQAWRMLFPSITVVLCFLHAFIKLRDRCKRLGEVYEQIKQQVWDSYHAPDETAFKQRLSQFKAWVQANKAQMNHSAVEALTKLFQREEQYALAFAHPTAYRTSNMLDRQMQAMARWLDSGRYFHGNLQAAEQRSRAWALLHNFRPYCPRAKVSEQFQSPAHKLNQFVYRENWLENLLVSSSCQTFRCRHKKQLN